MGLFDWTNDPEGGRADDEILPWPGWHDKANVDLREAAEQDEE
jgi:hypothetical protein